VDYRAFLWLLRGYVVKYLKQEKLVDLTAEQVGKMALDLGAKKKGK